MSASSSTRSSSPSASRRQRSVSTKENSNEDFQNLFLKHYEPGLFGGTMGKWINSGYVITESMVKERADNYPNSETAKAYQAYLREKSAGNEAQVSPSGYRQTELNDKLLRAVWSNNPFKILQAIAQGADVNAKFEKCTIFEDAFGRNGKLPLKGLRTLLTVPGFNWTKKDYSFVLNRIIIDGDQDLVTKLLELDIDVDIKIRAAQDALQFAAEISGEIINKHGGPPSPKKIKNMAKNCKIILEKYSKIDIGNGLKNKETILNQLVGGKYNTEIVEALLSVPGVMLPNQTFLILWRNHPSTKLMIEHIIIQFANDLMNDSMACNINLPKTSARAVEITSSLKDNDLPPAIANMISRYDEKIENIEDAIKTIRLYKQQNPDTHLNNLIEKFSARNRDYIKIIEEEFNKIKIEKTDL